MSTADTHGPGLAALSAGETTTDAPFVDEAATDPAESAQPTPARR